MSELSLNPCKACLDKFNSGDCDINNINQCCYDTLAAFNGSSSVNEIRNSPEAQNCIQCVTNSMKSVGRDRCDFQLSPPPIWNNVQHYFPNLLQELKNVKIAHKMCLSKCEKTPYPNQCKQNCDTDANAVEAFSPPTPRPSQNNVKSNPTYNEISKSNPVPFYIGLIVISILLAFVIFMFVRSLYLKN